MTSSDFQELVDVVRLLGINDPAKSPVELRAVLDVEAPLPDGAFREELLDADGVPVTWISAATARADRVVLHFHGGAYVGGNARSHRGFAARLSTATDASVILVDYRLAPEHHFPAAYDDAVIAYRWLTGPSGRALAPASVIVSGDSAGGGLAAALLAGLRGRGEPAPAGGALLSPWTDLALTGQSHAAVGGADPLCSTGMLRTCAQAYLAGADPEDPRASALHADLAGLPPLLIHVGEVEVLRDDATRLAERARAAGTAVDLLVAEGMVHVWHLFAQETPEGRRDFETLTRWITARLASTAFSGQGPSAARSRAAHGSTEIRRGSVLEDPAAGPDSLGRTLTRRILHRMAENSLDTATDTMLIPAQDFTSEQRHRAEIAMMRRTPQVVGWGGEIPTAGDYTTKDLLDTSVLLVRGEDGAARAFVNACAHRGAKVATGCGHAARFTCPYHAWSYSGDGRLVGVPSRQMFDPTVLEARGLRGLAVAETAGLLIVNLDPDGTAEGTLDEIREELEPFRFGRYAHAGTVTSEVRANWKLTVDVNFEGYHFPFLHRTSLSVICTNNSVFDVFGPHCRWAFPFRDLAELRDAPETDWPAAFRGTVAHGLFPSTILLEGPGITQMLRVYPGKTPAESVLHISAGWFGPVPNDDIQRGAMAGLDGALQVLRGEDLPAAEMCQHGVTHGLDTIVIGRNEPLMAHLHRTWDGALATRASS
ncbi:alpha/beta hydrolase fold domain-containing protein [Pseudofrankia inefficax]|uniref:Rieske (2Fe-2S) iron-sulfur domain protein n=1 Tax=Pseudofrankia inefficax (strain DSM 45817 / CECT 9037 / DDB 130130 / EuI1c) TaxID=298654 RepID=E3IWH3_PSEI1|nr:alpha/beta hydrolase fold domain-containing protein [Pseudofrankia inefficax]ADP80156.1 Rieske (2Fe-2S) iron-sulfur domain protein [Pseudofrankia inefficax]